MKLFFYLLTIFCSHLVIAQNGLFSYEKANELADKQQFKEAIRLYTFAIDSLEAQDKELNKIHLVKAYNNRGIAYGQSKNLLLALFDFNKVIELDKQQIDTYLNRANVELSMAMFKEALADFNKVLQAKPQSVEVYYQRGMMLLFDTQQFTEAEKELKKATELQPQNAEILAYHALALFETGQNAQALAQVNKSIALNKNFAEAYYYRSQIYRVMNQKDKALQDINKALELAPKTPEYEALRSKLK
jgi:tetratricopeptide (TPR) repeat protein